MSEPIDITPEGSVVPVYLDDTPREPVDPGPDLEAEFAARQAELLGATQDLMATFGWSEARARAITGYTGPLD